MFKKIVPYAQYFFFWFIREDQFQIIIDHFFAVPYNMVYKKEEEIRQ